MPVENSEDNVLPFDKDTVRFYSFYFEGIEKPMVIESKSKADALIWITQQLQLHPHIQGVRLINMKVKTPIYGVTNKEENGYIYIWAGLDHSQTGWLIEDEFKQLKK